VPSDADGSLSRRADAADGETDPKFNEFAPRRSPPHPTARQRASPEFANTDHIGIRCRPQPESAKPPPHL